MQKHETKESKMSNDRLTVGSGKKNPYVAAFDAAFKRIKAGDFTALVSPKSDFTLSNALSTGQVRENQSAASSL